MMSKFTALTDELHDYLVEHGAREDATLRRLREQTAAMGDIAVMQIAPDQGAFMTLLCRLIGARRALEVGTFTGYSAICIARGLAPGGELVACEIDPDYASIAREHFERGAVAERIDLRVGPALETLAGVEADPPFDLAFIDADKASYPDYFEACLKLLRPGGLLILDNILMAGRVLDPDQDDAGAQAVDALNRSLADDERVDLALVGIADGLALARRR